MTFHYSLFLSREAHPASPTNPLFMQQCDAAEKCKPLGIGWGKLQTKKGLILPYIKYPYPLNYKLARKGFSAVVASFCRIKNISFASPPYLHSG